MNYLIDTHILLWVMSGDKRVGSVVRKILDDNNNDFYVSSVSLWEIAIKESIGKLKLKGSLLDIRDFLIGKGINIINFDCDDLETLRSLPFYHQDPFDRLIVAQALTKNLEIITSDSNVKKYL